jgi:nucleotide-binding universal stress UspA family protein
MYRILVAIDGSQHALHAASYAARRARAAGCKVDLLHVEKPAMAWEVGPVSPAEVVSAVREAESAEVLRVAAGLFERTTDVETHAVTGDPAAAILEEAERLSVDEIIVGSRGRRAIGAALLGSVAYKIVHSAKVPVVIVR